MVSAEVAEALAERFTCTVPDPGELTATAATEPVTEPDAAMDTSPARWSARTHIPRPNSDVTEPDRLIDVVPDPRLSV